MLFKNEFNLPTVGEVDDNSPPINQESRIKDHEYGFWPSMDARRQERIETIKAIYGNENRLGIESNNRHRLSFNRDDRYNLRSSGFSNDLIENVNKTQFHHATNATAVFHNDKNSLPEENYFDDGEDDFNEGMENRRRIRTRIRRGKNRSHCSISRFEKGKQSVRRKPSLLLPTPIIVMGFPKAGTSSIFSFFQTQGLSSQHWYCCDGAFSFYQIVVSVTPCADFGVSKIVYIYSI